MVPVDSPVAGPGVSRWAKGALAADRGGAPRIELCAGLVEGGITPSQGTVETVLERIAAHTVVLVRPRGGDFLYDGHEMDVLLRDVRQVRAAGAYGIATGAREVHFTAPAQWPSPMAYRNPEPRMGAASVPGEFQRAGTDTHLVERMVKLAGDSTANPKGAADEEKVRKTPGSG